MQAKGMIVATKMSAFLVLGSTVPLSAAQDCAVWEQKSTTGPSPRGAHAMAFDAARGVVVLFGGGCSGSGALFGDTWTWNGTAWTQMPVAGPSPRIASAMVYDSNRAKVVLFGGYDGARFYSDTWEWDGQAWRRLADSGPSDRDLTAMAYDSDRSRVVLFSGNNSPADTWEWDGSSWSLRSMAGPSARFGSSMTFDSARHECVLYGGTTLAGDTWGWDGSGWIRKNPATSPSALNEATLAFDSARQRVLLTGGSSGPTIFGETWEWDGATWTQMAGLGPARHGHSVAFDTLRNRLVLFGGGSCLGDTWEMLAVPAPAITQQPQDLLIDGSVTATFIVLAEQRSTCERPLEYRWSRRNPAVPDENAPNAWIELNQSANYRGETTYALTIIQPTPGLAGPFRCRVTDPCGCSAVSGSADFTVSCPADFNHDGGVDGADVEAFFARWENGC